MLQRLVETAGLPETRSDLPGRLVLAFGVLSLTVAVVGTLL